MAMTSALPPLPAMRVFEAAARHGNFSRAAEELGMTQAAVSYQIRVLEDRVGAPVFVRHARGVALSEVGQRLSRPTREAFDLLRDAYSEARGRAGETLSISVTATFAAKILAHRIGGFQIENPAIAVRVDVNQTLVDFSRDEVDVAIRLGRGDWSDTRSEMIMPSTYTPMLSPDLAHRIGGVKQPADLLKLPIIEPSSPWWQRWFEAAGLPDAMSGQGAGLELGAQLIEANATIAGEGVGMLTPSFYRRAVEQGRLLQPFELVLEDTMSYWLVYPESRRNAPAIKAFRDWLMSELNEAGLIAP